MSATVLLAVVFVLSLTLVTWLLNQLPQRMIVGFDATHRHSPLDGIRGILALSVFTHHFFKNYFFLLELCGAFLKGVSGLPYGRKLNIRRYKLGRSHL